MGILLFAFLIGCVCGLRSMTAPAVVAWGAHLGWLHLDGSWLAFLANKISLVVFSLLAIGELIADKLPFIPGRTQPGPLGARIVFGAICGAALCLSGGASPMLGRGSRRLRGLQLPPLAEPRSEVSRSVDRAAGRFGGGRRCTPAGLPSIKIQTHPTVAGILSLPGGRHGRV
jgi:hypothetical protein